MPDPIIINPSSIPDAGAPASTDTVLLIRGGVIMKTLASAFGISGGGGGTILSTPSLTATPASSSQINLSWSNVANELSYELQRSPNGSTGWTTIATPAANATAFNDTGLTAGTTYYYRIRAIGDGVTYLNSAYSSVQSAATSGSGATPLSTPTLTAAVISSTQIDLSWTNVANESSYRLEWSPNGTSGWTQIGGTIPANTTTYSHTGLTPATAYFYRVTAVGDGVTYSDSGYGTDNDTTSAGGLVHQSTFTAANGTAITAYTPEAGSAWANQSGVAEIQGNEWSPVSASGGACVSDTTISTTGNYTYRANYRIPAGGGRAYFQFKTNGAGNGVYCDMFLGVLTCGQIAVAGGYTTITTFTPTPSVNNTSAHEIEFVITGTSVEVFVDGTSQGTFSYSSTLESMTKVGIGCENTSALFTSFEVE